jgi:hypothetical protein
MHDWNRTPPPDRSDTSDRSGHPLVEQALAEARAFVAARPAPDVTDAVMRAIARPEPAPPAATTLGARLARALWSPRTLTLRLRPAYALVALAIVAGAALSAPRPVTAPVATPDQPVADRPFLVQFRLDAAGVSDVHLAGTFTGWEPRHALHETAPGVWTIMLPLPHGVHDYAFVIDGRHWMPDPHAPRISDGFGGTNSRLALLPPAGDPQS